jgi:hypothetical protein
MISPFRLDADGCAARRVVVSLAKRLPVGSMSRIERAGWGKVPSLPGALDSEVRKRDQSPVCRHFWQISKSVSSTTFPQVEPLRGAASAASHARSTTVGRPRYRRIE